MASKTFLDKTGLAYFWGKIKALIPTKTSDITNDSGYITNSDYASAFTGGTVKVAPAFGVEMSESGELKGRIYDASGYSSMWNDAIVSKGTMTVALADKQDTLVSGTNIKTVNGNSLLGSGDITISGSGSQVSFTQSLTSGTAVGTLTIDGTNTTLYAPTNTDTKVTQTVRTTDGSFPILLRGTSAGTTTTTTTTSFGTKITANPSTGTIAATSGEVASGDTNLVTGGTVYAAIPQLSTSTTSTSTTTAATSSAVRTAYRNGAWYATCATAASTVAKVGTCTNFGLETGAHITVKFTYANTAASPTLNVNSTGAKAIYINGAAATSGAWKAGDVKEFVYDGTNWVMTGGAPNIHYGTSAPANTVGSDGDIYIVYSA